MSTHAIAFFITASAYSFARKHADNPKYVFGTGKIGDLAAFFYPEKLSYLKALYVAFVGLSVNIGSGLILGLQCKSIDSPGDDHNALAMSHGHGHGHSHGHQVEKYEYDSEEEDDHHDEHGHDETFHIPTSNGTIVLSIFEEGIPPEFRISYENWSTSYPKPNEITVTTTRPDHSIQIFEFDCLVDGDITTLQSNADIPEPHEFTAKITVLKSDTNEFSDYLIEFKEHEDHGHSHGHNHNDDDNHDHYHGSNNIDHSNDNHDHDETFHIETSHGTVVLSIFEEGIPPVFRISYENWSASYPKPNEITVTTTRPDHSNQIFEFDYLLDGSVTTLQSTADIPEPHEFSAKITIVYSDFNEFSDYLIEFKEHEGHGHSHGHSNDILQSKCSFHNPITNGEVYDHAHNRSDGYSHIDCEVANDDHNHDHDHHHNEHNHDKHSNNHNVHEVALDVKPLHESVSSKHRKKMKYEQDNNFRAAIIHVVADAFVSVLVIIAIVIAGNVPGTLFLDPLVAIIGAFVIINWAYTLGFDTSCNLLDISPDMKLTHKIENVLERDGSKVYDLHVWRLGPGHLGAVISILPPSTRKECNRDYYLHRLKRFKALSHVTIE
eukprot:gene23484-30443_t